jgi:tetratricopeptide (TPR) repeat protein
MRKILFGGLCFILLFSFTGSALATDDLAQADALYNKGGMENYKNSIPLYIKAVQENPNSYEANWKCARANRDYGDKAKKNKVEGWKDICATYGKEGMKYAEKAIALEPEKPDGHYYYGLSVGIYSDGVSILTALKEGLKNKTQESFEKVYALDKMYEDAGAILALGRFWTVLPLWMKDYDKAMKYLREYQATQYFDDPPPDGPIFLAELLLKIGGDKNKAEAKPLLEKAAQSDQKYYSDWAKRLLSENKL